MISADVRDRLQDLSRRWELPDEAPAQFATILELVADEPTSITTVRDPAQGVATHVADSLTGLAVPALRAARRLADLGSGGGFPGLALAVALPATEVTVVESVGKKVDFLARAAAAAGLRNVTAVQARVEDWPGGLLRHEVVTARALAPLPILVEYAAPLLADEGRLVAWKGPRDEAEEGAGAKAASIVGLHPESVIETSSGGLSRHLHVYLKVHATPDRFPRRPGMARKRPLAALTRG